MNKFPYKPNYKYYSKEHGLCEVYYSSKDIGLGYPGGTIYILFSNIQESELPQLDIT